MLVGTLGTPQKATLCIGFTPNNANRRCLLERTTLAPAKTVKIGRI